MLEKMKIKIKYVSDFIQWNINPYKKYDGTAFFKIKEAINSLKNKSFYKYQGFLNSDEVENLKKKIFLNINEAQTKIRKEHLFRQRSVFPGENPIFQDLINNNFITSVAKGFYNAKHVHFMKITYELKKGIGKFNLNKMKDDIVNQEYHYHADRHFGQLKFCLLLNDIGKNNGPLSVIPGSQKWPRSFVDFKHRIKTFYGNGHAAPMPTFDREKIEKFFNEGNQVKATGKKGDLIVLNTCAYHKGDNLKENFKREVLWFYTKFPSSFESFTGKIKNSIIKKN